jgi:hypothetical protein
LFDQHLCSIEEGTPEINRQRMKCLWDLGADDPIAENIHTDISIIMTELHGQCFYNSEESRLSSRVLKYTVKDILEKMGTLDEE